MRRGGDTFPGAGSGPRSAVGRAASGRAALDQDLDSILGGNDDDIFGSSSQQQTNTRGRSTTSAPGKKGSLTSGATDEDFYSSLAQMAGDGFDGDDDDPDESLSEADAKKMADSLAGLDDMESDLFGGSLGKKTTPKKPTKSTKTVSEPKKINPDFEPPPSVNSTRAKTSSPSSAKTGEKKDTKQDTSAVATKPKEKQKPSKKFDFGEFDEDDPLAGLLSDEDDEPKPKPKKSTTAKKAGSSGVPSQDSTEERPKSSRGRRAANREPANSPSPPVTPEHQPAVKRDKGESGAVSSPPGSPAAAPDSRGEDVRSSQASPRDKGIGKTAARKAKPSKDEINFDSDEDLPGLNDSIEKTPRDSPTPPPRSKPERSNRKKSQEPSEDIFGDDDDLPGTETRSDSPSRNSRFSELLGKKEKDEPKKQVPKSLDDFMANISGKSPAGSTASKKVSSPTSEESFQFGGYMPSAASSSQSRSRGGLARPDTAPSSTKRSVRFSDDLGLGDELFGSERPSTAPGERSGRRQAKRGDKDENINGSYLDDNKKPPEGNKPIRRGTASNASEEVKDEPVMNPQAVKPQDDRSPAVQVMADTMKE